MIAARSAQPRLPWCGMVYAGCNQRTARASAQAPKVPGMRGKEKVDSRVAAKGKSRELIQEKCPESRSL